MTLEGVVQAIFEAPRPVHLLALATVVVVYYSIFAIVRGRLIARPHQKALIAHADILKSRVLRSCLDENVKQIAHNILATEQGRSRIWSAAREGRLARQLVEVELLLLDSYSDAEVRTRLQSIVAGIAPVLSKDRRTAVRKLLEEVQRDTKEAQEEVNDEDTVAKPENSAAKGCVCTHWLACEILRWVRKCGCRKAVPPCSHEGVEGKLECTKSSELRALLYQVEEQTLGEQLREYLSMLVLHRKTWWLVTTALVLISAVGAIAYRLTVVMLAGAVGGFVAIAFRFTRATRPPTEYSTYWTVITLAPPAGALAGAAAVILVIALHQLDVLGVTFQNLDRLLAGDPPTATAYATASALSFVAGFSARWLDQLAKKLGQSTMTEPPGGVPTTDSKTATTAQASDKEAGDRTPATSGNSSDEQQP